MTDKKNICKFEDYFELKGNMINSHLNYKSTDFKLDRIYPKNINIRFNQEGKDPFENQSIQHNKHHSNLRLINSSQNKFYHEYLNIKDLQNNSKKAKITHIFNIKSINLIDKLKYEKERQTDKTRLRTKYSSKEIKRNFLDSSEKENLRGLNLILVEKKRQSSIEAERKLKQKKNSLASIPKFSENKSLICLKNGDYHFENKLNEYFQYLKENCESHGLVFKEIQNYAKNSLVFYVGKGNNGNLIKEILKKRWWWGIQEQKNKKFNNFTWTQLKQKSYYAKRQKNSTSDSHSKRSQSYSKKNDCKIQSNCNNNLQQVCENQIHNHFQNNEFLGNKKALYYNMKAYYERKGKNVFDYLPVTFHVKRYNDETWKQFTDYYYEDVKNNPQCSRLWIIKPGQNSNRGNGITIHSDYDKIKEWVQGQISGANNEKKTFIIQKYIDRPFLYNKRKFDIRCYMLLVRLNGIIKGYWYNEGYIRTSCYQFQLNDTSNEFIHLTNDAIQVNSDKYGKYEDGNKLSFHNFQKYLDNQKHHHNFYEDICPQLKRIATDSIEASHHLLGEWNTLPTFQIFGLDFMIDQNFKPWLIEINTNPCLETSSFILQRVIPRMVDNAFKFSLDLIFPPPLNWQNSKKHYLSNKISNNLFELIFDEQKVDKNLNISHEDIIIQMGEIQEDNQVYEEKGEKQIIINEENTENQ